MIIRILLIAFSIGIQSQTIFKYNLAGDLVSISGVGDVIAIVDTNNENSF
jgi:hypothetical protein